MQLAFRALLSGLIVSIASAQNPPAPSDLTVVTSQVNSEVTISYKEASALSVCRETTNKIARLKSASKLLE